MKKLTIETAELLAQKKRDELGIGTDEPVNMKTVMRQLNIMAIYRPLSEKLFGLSLPSNKREAGSTLLLHMNCIICFMTIILRYISVK